MFILEVGFLYSIAYSCVEMVCKSSSFRWKIQINMDENAVFHGLFVGLVLLLCDFVTQTFYYVVVFTRLQMSFFYIRVWYLEAQTMFIAVVVATKDVFEDDIIGLFFVSILQ